MYYINYVIGKRIELEYDSEKNQRNIDERGLPFDLAEFVLADPNVVIKHDLRKDYGESRFIAYGLVEGLRLRFCYTLRGRKIRVISLHQVHKKTWEKYYGKNDN
jgi:uncharacterized DUF497 family protein